MQNYQDWLDSNKDGINALEAYNLRQQDLILETVQDSIEDIWEMLQTKCTTVHIPFLRADQHINFLCTSLERQGLKAEILQDKLMVTI